MLNARERHPQSVNDYDQWINGFVLLYYSTMTSCRQKHSQTELMHVHYLQCLHGANQLIKTMTCFLAYLLNIRAINCTCMHVGHKYHVTFHGLTLGDANCLHDLYRPHLNSMRGGQA